MGIISALLQSNFEVIYLAYYSVIFLLIIAWKYIIKIFQNLSLFLYSCASIVRMFLVLGFPLGQSFYSSYSGEWHDESVAKAIES